VPRSSPAASRVVAVLNFLAERGGPCSLSEIARSLDLNKATLHGAVGELVAAGFVHRQGEHKTLSLGPAVVAFGQAAVADDQKLVLLATEPMNELSRTTGMPCFATRPERDQFIVVSVAGPASDETWPQVGGRSRIAPPHGLVFRAWAPERQIGRWLESLPSGMPSISAIEEMLRVVRENGASVTLAEPDGAASVQELFRITENNIDDAVQETLRRFSRELDVDEAELIKPGLTTTAYMVRSISAPVFDARDRVRLGLSLQPMTKLSFDEIVDLRQRVISTADQLTLLGGGFRPTSA
jgi:DNA-binding IclR family transcriptional regulator